MATTDIILVKWTAKPFFFILHIHWDCTVGKITAVANFYNNGDV